MDDIKRALEAIYAVKEETQPVAELAPTPKGAQAAAAHMDKETEIKGSFNAKTFGGLLGMDSTEASMLASFLAKHKKGMPPGRNELLAAADAFRALVDADPQVTNQAMMMLRRVSAAEAIESPVAEEEQVEEVAVEDQIEEEIKDLAEGIRITKEGVEECWGEMQAPAAPAAAAEGPMTVSISMPNKQISVTTDSADEVMNLLKLAGIAVGGAEEMPAAPAEPAQPEAEPEMVGAPMTMVIGGESPAAEEGGEEEKGDEEGDEKKESVEQDEPAVDENAYNMAAAAAARAGKDEFEFPEGSGKMHPVKMKKDTAHAMAEGEEVDEATDPFTLARDMAKDYYSKDENKPGQVSQRDQSFLDKAKAGYKMAQQMNKELEKEGVEEGMEEAARILALAGLDESKLANSPAGTSMDEPMEADRLPSTPGDGSGHPDFGANRANNQGENPMGIHSADVEESFNVAMGEYRKFVAENISQGVKKV